MHRLLWTTCRLRRSRSWMKRAPQHPAKHQPSGPNTTCGESPSLLPALSSCHMLSRSTVYRNTHEVKTLPVVFLSLFGVKISGFCHLTNGCKQIPGIKLHRSSSTAEMLWYVWNSQRVAAYLDFYGLKFEAEHHFLLITFIYVFVLFQMVFWDDEPLSGPEPPAEPGKQRESVPHPAQREGQRGIRSVRQDTDKRWRRRRWRRKEDREPEAFGVRGFKTERVSLQLENYTCIFSNKMKYRGRNVSLLQLKSEEAQWDLFHWVSVFRDTQHSSFLKCCFHVSQHKSSWLAWYVCELQASMS